MIHSGRSWAIRYLVVSSLSAFAAATSCSWGIGWGRWRRGICRGRDSCWQIGWHGRGVGLPEDIGHLHLELGQLLHLAALSALSAAMPSLVTWMLALCAWVTLLTCSLNFSLMVLMLSLSLYPMLVP